MHLHEYTIAHSLVLRVFEAVIYIISKFPCTTYMYIRTVYVYTYAQVHMFVYTGCSNAHYVYVCMHTYIRTYILKHLILYASTYVYCHLSFRTIMQDFYCASSEKEELELVCKQLKQQVQRIGQQVQDGNMKIDMYDQVKM